MFASRSRGAPDRPHRFYTQSLDNQNKGVVIFDGDSGQMEAMLPAGYEYNLAFAPDRKSIYLSETYWTHGNRGDQANHGEQEDDTQYGTDQAAGALFEVPGNLNAQP